MVGKDMHSKKNLNFFWMMPATNWKVDRKKVEHQKEGGKKTECMEINQKIDRRLVNINKREAAIALEIVRGLGHVLALKQ